MVIDLDSLQKLSILQLKSKYFLVKLLNPVKKRLFLMVERGGGAQKYESQLSKQINIPAVQ